MADWQVSASLMSVPQRSVWLLGQRPVAVQRRGKYVPGSAAHPQRMWPDLATAAIIRYSQPGDLVLDPLAGVGTTLIEAVAAGRDTIGVEYEPDWVRLAQANLHRANQAGGTGQGMVLAGDATALSDVLPSALRGRVALVVTSPPHGRPLQGRVAHRTRRVDLSAGMTAVLTGCLPLLRPDATVVVTLRPHPNYPAVEAPDAIPAAGSASGLTLIEHTIGVLTGAHDGRLVPTSPVRPPATTTPRWDGFSLHLSAYEDIYVFRHQPTADLASDQHGVRP
ncbi:site-specific DNA-methyltransferase [Micromonospora sp. C51]|uniref:TRM11 family SAM-dependent methyltransferase n=1 Tax=Micromonospora sp. C51 TaxID=2824879 RepID=UPI001B35E12C|nr:DNA methyltransferase [Micromonospora sp. C51]MBQ1052763.1 site-specific DNA-methyltransferase [Micromonospora sp. C51]